MTEVDFFTHVDAASAEPWHVFAVDKDDIDRIRAWATEIDDGAFAIVEIEPFALVALNNRDGAAMFAISHTCEPVGEDERAAITETCQNYQIHENRFQYNYGQFLFLS